MIYRLVIIFTFFIIYNNVYTYEVKTHQKISAEAYLRSIVSNSDFLKAIGAHERKYPDFSGKYLTIDKLIQKGASFEDDVEETSRPLNHFYDPQKKGTESKGLRPCPPTDDCYPSPKWALEDTEFDIDEQHFSLWHANDYYFEALTSTNLEERQNNYGLLFQSLGHMIHHVQDMAQPQHTRNDAHCNLKKCYVFNVYAPSFYEESTNKLASKLRFDGYPDLDISKFSKVRDFWGLKSTDPGLAVFSSYNFLSEGTNYRLNAATSNWDNFVANTDGIHDFPVFDGKNKLEIDIKQLDPKTNLTGSIVFFGNTVKDNYLGTSLNNPFATSFSLFSEDLINAEKNSNTSPYKGVFTLNRFNLDVTRELLIPRAVAYSSGLINYFFRGRLDVTKTEQTIDANNNILLEITVKNISSNGFNFSNGQFEVFYDLNSTKGKREKAEYSAGVDGKVTTLVNRNEVILKIVLPNDIDTKSENPFFVIYKGVIGEEAGIAGKVFNIKQDTALLAWAIPDGGDIRQLWRSVDYGKTWQVVIDSINDAIGAKRIYPVGKGEAFATLMPGGVDRIVYHSTDNGLTWSRLNDSAYSVEDRYRLVQALPLGILSTGETVLLSADNKQVKETNGDIHLDYFPTFSLDKGKSWRSVATPIGLSHLFGYINAGKGQVLAVGTEYTGLGNCEPGCYFQKFRYALYLSRDYGKYWSRLRYNDAYEDRTSGFAVHEQDSAFTETQRIVGRGDISDMATLAISDDLGTSWQHENLVAQHVDWPYTTPQYSVYLGQGRAVSYVYDGSFSYPCTIAGCPAYEGMLITEDYGQRWQAPSYRSNNGLENDWPGKMDMWGFATIEELGIVTNDTGLLESIEFTPP